MLLIETSGTLNSLSNILGQVHSAVNLDSELVRGTFELQIRNNDGTKSLNRVNNSHNTIPFVAIPESGSKSSSPKVPTRQINSIYKRLKKSTNRLKWPFLTNSESTNKELTQPVHSKTNFSNSCHILPPIHSVSCDTIGKTSAVNCNNSNQQSTPSLNNKCDNNGVQKEKNNLISFKRDHLACCILS